MLDILNMFLVERPIQRIVSGWIIFCEMASLREVLFLPKKQDNKEILLV